MRFQTSVSCFRFIRADLDGDTASRASSGRDMVARLFYLAQLTHFQAFTAANLDGLTGWF